MSGESVASSTGEPIPTPESVKVSPAREPSARPQQVAHAEPFLELIVENAPEETHAAQPQQSSCSWVSQDVDTGVVKSGSVLRNYDEDGQLQSVELRLPVNTAADGTDHTTEKEDPDESSEHSSLISGGLYAGILRAVGLLGI